VVASTRRDKPAGQTKRNADESEHRMNRRETFLANQTQVVKNWRVVNAEGQSLGRLAAEVATVLMGKHKPSYTPHVDSGDFVIVLNASKVYMSGNKADHKMAWHYTGYPGGRRTESYGELRERQPERLIALAVRRMLPKSRLGRVMLSNMKVFKGGEHPYASNNPVELQVG